MLTIEDLKNFGANVEEAMDRCLNNEAFYLKLVEKTLRDPSFGKLKQAIEEKDYSSAFELAHALKGVTANLALTPLFEPINKMTDLLRDRTDTDYSSLLEEALAKKEELCKLL